MISETVVKIIRTGESKNGLTHERGLSVSDITFVFSGSNQASKIWPPRLRILQSCPGCKVRSNSNSRPAGQGHVGSQELWRRAFHGASINWWSGGLHCSKWLPFWTHQQFGTKLPALTACLT